MKKQKSSIRPRAALSTTSVKLILVWAILATIVNLVLICILVPGIIVPILVAIGQFLVEFRKGLVELGIECTSFAVKALKASTEHR